VLLKGFVDTEPVRVIEQTSSDEEWDETLNHSDEDPETELKFKLDLSRKKPQNGWSLIQSGSQVLGMAFCVGDRTLVFEGKYSEEYVEALNKQFKISGYTKMVDSVSGDPFEKLFNLATRLHIVITNESEFTIGTLVKPRYNSNCGTTKKTSEFIGKFIEGKITLESIPSYMSLEADETVDADGLMKFLSQLS